MKKGGYGLVYQDITRNCNIPAPAKGLYAYLSSFCGVDDKCYPGVETITKEMGFGKDTFYRHINILVAAGVVKKHQTTGEGGKFGRTIYKLTHEVAITDFPIPQNTYTVKSTTEFKETNSNNINNNNKNSNNKKSSSRFTPPTVEEVAAYCRERGNNVDPQRFVNFYEAKGWMIGKNKMKSWKAAVHTWESRDNGSSTRVAEPEHVESPEHRELFERYRNLPSSPDDPFQ